MKRALIILLTAVFFGILFHPVTVKAASEDEILELMNYARAQAGLGEVSIDESLTSVAYTRAQECATRFSHTRPNGKSWQTVSSITNGENLAHAINSNQSQPENVVLAWLLSPTHKANVMRSSFTSVGIAYYYSDTGETYIVAEFN